MTRVLLQEISYISSVQWRATECASSSQLYKAHQGIWLVAEHLCFKYKKVPIVAQLVVTSNWLDMCELIRHHAGLCNQYMAWVG